MLKMRKNSNLPNSGASIMRIFSRTFSLPLLSGKKCEKVQIENPKIQKCGNNKLKFLNYQKVQKL